MENIYPDKKRISESKAIFRFIWITGVLAINIYTSYKLMSNPLFLSNSDLIGFTGFAPISVIFSYFLFFFRNVYYDFENKEVIFRHFIMPEIREKIENIKLIWKGEITLVYLKKTKRYLLFFGRFDDSFLRKDMHEIYKKFIHDLDPLSEY